MSDWRYGEGMAVCSCGYGFQVRYRLPSDASMTGPYTTTARRCLRCDKYIDIAILAGGYYLAFEASKKLLERISGEREHDAQQRRLQELLAAQERERDREAVRDRVREKELHEDPRNLVARLHALDAEIAKREAVLAEVGNVDPYYESAFYDSVCDYRDELRKVIAERDALLWHPHFRSK